MWLAKNQGVSLPFQYEYGYFDDGSSFLSVGGYKELYNAFKIQRSEEQGKDKHGKVVQINKKSIAYGLLSINEAEVYEMTPRTFS